MARELEEEEARSRQEGTHGGRPYRREEAGGQENSRSVEGIGGGIRGRRAAL
jgi:hypothetical protein